MPTDVIHSIKSSGGHYTSLAAWQTAQIRNLVTSDERAIAEIGYEDYGLDTTLPSVSGWTTDDTRYVLIRPESGAKHDGKPWDEFIDRYSGAAIRPSSNGGSTMRMIYGHSNSRLHIEDMIIDGMSQSWGYTVSLPANGRLINCLVGGSTDGEGFYAVGLSAGAAAINTVVWEGGTGFLHPFTGNSYTLNCVAANCGTGYVVYGPFTGTELTGCVRNSIAYNCSAAGFMFPIGSESSPARTEYCATDDNSLPATTGNRNNQTFSFEDADLACWFKLKDDDTGAKGYGTDLSAFTVPVTTDILGVARTTPWDIGAFQVTSAGPQPPEVIAESSAFGAVFSPSVRASAVWSDGFSASDSRSAVAHATASIVEGMAAGDDSSNVLETLREIAAGATGDAVMDAFGQAVAAVLAGVQAGEQWAMDILSAGSLSSGVSLGDFWSADTADSVSRAINAGSVAAAHFSFAAGVLAALTEGASVGDAFGAVAQIVAEISEAVFAGDAWSTADISARLIQAGAAAGDAWAGVTSQVIYSLTAGVAAGSVLTGISRSAAILSAPAFASSQFSARIAGQGSFSVGAITITAAIRAAINLR